MFSALGLSAFILISSLNIVSAATCYGPNACLNGWVWRQAIPTDYVCVTPAIRTQTAQDNAAASSRVSPNGGPYGPDTCKDGYVWREAYTNDVVCVLPATRTEAANDNAQAANRVASLNIWANTWNPGPNTYPYIKINGDYFDFGNVQVAIFDDEHNLVQGWTTVTAGTNSGYGGGSWGWESTINDCSANVPAGTGNGYAIAQDMFSGCYSATVPVEICYNL
jgi:hypothetical protein